MPFEPKIHKQLLYKDFSDVEPHLDLNNIPDEDPLGGHGGGGGQDHGDNPINLDQNWLQLLTQSLLPWNHLPNQGAGGNNRNNDEDMWG